MTRRGIKRHGWFCVETTYARTLTLRGASHAANQRPLATCEKLPNYWTRTRKSVQLPDFVLETGRKKKPGARAARPHVSVLRATQSCGRAAALRLQLFGLARTRGFRFAILVAQDRFTRKLDLVALAADALHQDLLSFLEFVAHVLHAPIGDLGDVQ